MSVNEAVCKYILKKTGNLDKISSMRVRFNLKPFPLFLEREKWCKISLWKMIARKRRLLKIIVYDKVEVIHELLGLKMCLFFSGKYQKSLIPIYSDKLVEQKCQVRPVNENKIYNNLRILWNWSDFFKNLELCSFHPID